MIQASLLLASFLLPRLLQAWLPPSTYNLISSRVDGRVVAGNQWPVTITLDNNGQSKNSHRFFIQQPVANQFTLIH